MQWQKDMPQNVKTYLDDISQAVIDNKLDKDSKYVQEVPGLIKQRSNYKINYNKSDLDGKVLSKIFEENAHIATQQQPLTTKNFNLKLK